jgi:hypothetical protein
MSPEKMDKNSLPIPHSHQAPQGAARASYGAGETAFLELSRRQKGQVFGVTSRGIFIRTEPGGIIFLSFEKFRGPLTINLAEPFTPFRTLQNGERASTGESRLQIPAVHIQVLTAPEIVWHIPQPDLLRAAPFSERLERCANLAIPLIAEKQNASFSPILHDLLSLAGEAVETEKASDLAVALLPLRRLAKQLPGRLHDRDLPSILEITSAFLGCGRGLTPSGDDFVMGLLLTLNRWPRSGWSGSLLEALNAQLITAARQRTTSLSTALLACAARGEADERLIAALDFICTGQGDEAGPAAGLAGWGASSGLDALAGMAAGLSEN